MSLLFQRTPPGLLTDEDAAAVQAHWKDAPEEHRPLLAAKLNEYNSFREHNPRPFSEAESKAYSVERGRVEAIFDDFDLATAEKPMESLDFFEGPEKEIRKRDIQNRTFLRHVFPGAPPDVAERDYELQRDAAADRWFNGRGKGNDALFHVEAKGWLERAKFTREVGQSLKSHAMEQALTEGTGDPDERNYLTWQQKAQAMEGYDPWAAGKYETEYAVELNEARHRLTPIREHANLVWKFLQGDDPKPQEYQPLADLLIQLPREQLRNVFDAVATRAKLLGPEVREGFFNRAATTASRAMDAFITGTLANTKEARNTEQELRYKGIINDLRNLRERDIDVVKPGGIFDQIAMGAAGTIPALLVAGAATPFALAGQFENEAFDEIRRNSLAAGVDEATAEKWAGGLSPVAGLAMGAIEQATFGIAKGPLSGIQGAIITRMAQQAAVTRVAAGVGVEFAEQWGQEVLQQAVPAIVQDAANALGAPVPDAEVTKQLAATASDPATFGVSLIFALGGAGRMPAVDRAVAAKDAGFTPEATTALVSATTPEAIQSAWVEGLKTRTEPTQKEQAEAIREAGDQQAADFKDAGVEAITRTPEGWEVTHSNGDRTRVDSAQAARVLVDDLKMVRAQEEADAWVEVADAFQEADKGKPREQRSGFVGEVVQGNEEGVTAAKPGKAAVSRGFDPDTLKTVHEEMALWPEEERAAGALILGENQFELRERLAGDVMALTEALTTRQNVGATVLTQVHERAESIMRAGLESGRITREEVVGFVNDAAQIFPLGRGDAGQRAFADLVHRVARGEGTETEVRETVSELVVADVLGRRKDGGRLPAGAITRGVTEALRRSRDKAERKTLGKFRALLRAARRYFRALFQTAATLTKARREGKLGKGDDFEAFVQKVLGLDEQAAHNEAVAKESGATVAKGERAFSLASADYLEALAPQLQAKGKPPKERRAMYAKAQEQVAGMARAMRFNDENEKPAARKEMLRSLATLDSILMAFPPEVRGKVGGFTKLAGLTTNEARAKYLAERVEKLDTVLEDYLRGEYRKELDKLVSKAAPDREAGKKSKGKITPEGHRYFDAVAAAIKMTPAQVDTRKGEIATALADEKTTPKQAADLFEEEQILDQFGALDAREGGDFIKEAEHIAKALEAAQEVYDTGKNKWRITEEQRLAEVKAMVDQALEALDGQDVAKVMAAIQAQKPNDQSKRKTILVRSPSELQSFGALLREVLGNEHPLALKWEDALREAKNERIDKGIEFKDKWRAALADATGQTGRKALMRAWDMGHKQTITVTLNPIATEKIDVPVETLGDILMGAADPASLGLRAEEVEALRDVFDSLDADSRKESVTLDRTTPGKAAEAKYSEAQGIAITLLAGQESARKGLERAGFDADALASIEEQLSPEAKKLRAFMRQEYFEGYEPTAAVFRQMFGVDLPQVKNYSPTAFYHMGTDTGVTPETGAIPEGGFRANFLANRKKHSAIPKIDNAITTLLGHVAQSQHWQSHAELVRELRGVFGNPKVKLAIEAKHGAQMLNSINDWVRAIEGNGLQRSHGVLDAVASWLTEAQAFVSLAWNLGTMMKQIPAVWNSAYEVGAGRYMRSAGRLLSGKAAVGITQMFDDPIIQRRLASGFAPELRAMKDNVFSAKPTRRRRMLEMGLDLLGLEDGTLNTFSAAVAYDATYTEAMKTPGMTEEAAHSLAIQAADRIVTRTAQPSDVSDRSLFELRLGAWGKLTFLFASEARQKVGMELGGWSRILTEGKAPTAPQMRAMIINHLVLAPFMQLMGSIWRDWRDDDDKWEEDNGWVPGFVDAEHWDWKDFVRASALGPLQGLPLINDLVSSFHGTGILSRIADAKRAAASILDEPAESLVEKNERLFKLVTATLQGMDAFTATTARLARNAFEMADNAYNTPGEEQAQEKRAKARERREDLERRKEAAKARGEG